MLNYQRVSSTIQQFLVVSKHPHWTDPSPGAKLRSALPLLGSEIGFSKVTRALGVQVLPGGYTTVSGWFLTGKQRQVAKIWSSQDLV